MRHRCRRCLDFREVVDNLALPHLASRQDHAEFGRYDYTQKAEYWALAWGTVLMVVTGAVLWWPETGGEASSPPGPITASQTVHFYEAWLAVLAIVVLALLLRPVPPGRVYPMSWIVALPER